MGSLERREWSVRPVGVGLVLLIAACTGGQGGVPDHSRPDAPRGTDGRADVAPAVDGRIADRAPPADRAGLDTGVADAGHADALLPDTTPPDTLAPDTLAPDAPPPPYTTLVSAAGSFCFDLAIDGTNVYWTCGNGDSKGTGVVQKTAIAGGPLVLLAGSQDAPEGIATDGTSVYWLSYGVTSSGGSVQSIPVGGGTIKSLAGGLAYPEELTFDGTNLYWTSYANAILAIPAVGGTAATLCGGSNPSAIATDGTNVYFTNSITGTLQSVPVAGTAATTLYTSTALNHIAVQGGTIYITAGGGGVGGVVESLPVAGGSPSPITTAPQDPNALALDATTAYFIDDCGASSACPAIAKVPLAGGAVVTLAKGVAGADAIAVDGTNVYAITWNGLVLKMPK